MFADQTVPVRGVMPHDAQTVLIVAMTAIAALMWIYAIRESRRRRDLVPLLIVIGCGLAVFYEPVGDALVKVFYTERGQVTWIHAFGRDIPAFIGILYFWYMPAGAMWLLRASERGVSAKAWWTRWAGFLAFATCFEMLVLKVAGTTWIYYDRQPFMVLKVPIFTPWTYVSFAVTIAAGTVALARYLPRRQQWLIVGAVPMLMVAGHAMTALPEGIAFYGTHNELLRHLGALGSAAFALVVSHLASLAYRKPLAAKPTSLDGTGASASPSVQTRPDEVLV
ncbi:MAG: hypothetical protein ACYDHH_26040 [Solirubrobacteraceae bacterium]